jgi:glucokinase
VLIAAAGPVVGRRATLSNARTAAGTLTIDGDALARAFSLERGMLLNDFEALSLSLPFLPAEGLVRLGGDDGRDDAGAPMVVVGPGTGLGVGALCPHQGRWLPIASEGGHASIGPATDDESALWPYLGEGPISAEELLSGRGLSRLYRAAAALGRWAALDATPAAVTARALAGEEPAAAAAVQAFLALLARFAGDMALAFGARGGVFIGGGIVPRLLPAMDRSAFRTAFEGGGRSRGYLDAVPLGVVTAPDAALIGLGALALAPERFALDHEGRGWACGGS